jgi:hypothetical protein
VHATLRLRGYGVSTPASSTGHVNPYFGCGWNETASDAGLPSHLVNEERAQWARSSNVHLRR